MPEGLLYSVVSVTFELEMNRMYRHKTYMLYRGQNTNVHIFNLLNVNDQHKQFWSPFRMDSD
jgi:hypothetical protein